MHTLTIILAILTLVFLAGFAFKLRQWVQAIRLDSNRIEAKLNQLHSQTNKSIESISRATQETVNAVCISSLGFQFPIFLGGWSIDAFLGKFLVQHLMEHRPKCIVELGSGSSTILIARTLQLMGINYCDHVAVDHEAKYLAISRDYARLNGLEDRVTWLDCPLQHYQELDKLWYGGLTEKLADRKIDLLIIDGPPGPLQPMSRYPALPLLLPYMSEHCTIILDDAIRSEEQDIARRWVQESPNFNLTFTHEGHGLAILTR
jgi:predicted O-methyltransferase YrrM